MGMNTTRKPLRLWPGVALAVLLCLLRFILPVVAPSLLLYEVFGGLICAVAIIVWWAFFSRAPWRERLGGVLVMVVALAASSRLLDKSVATGMMGMMFPFYALPTLSLALAAWALLTSRLSDGLRRVTMVATILLAVGVWTLVRTNGMTGNGNADLAWRWSKTREQKLVEQQAVVPTVALPVSLPVVAPAPAPAPEPAVEQPVKPPVRRQSIAGWPGFRGPHRDSIIPGLKINTDWSATPPVQLWRRQIGPGWSSFAVNGDLLYTQEQRGDDEIVACYNAATGKPVWAHRDAARFWESNAGPGPRATPTLSDGRAYTFGATGIVNALDASNGKVLWTHNAASDTGRKIPGWGFASSPLVMGDTVIVAASGQLAAYDAATGAPRWTGPKGGGASYSSPHLLTIDGVPQVLLMSSIGVTSVAPADGSLLWKHEWASDTRIMQPAMTPEGDLLISGGDGMGGTGLRRISVVHGPSGWTTQERWTSTGLKSNFNDFVVHDGHVFGFDGGILACVDLKDGRRVWKGGRYGHGQLVLLRDQGVLLVLGEEGELALVKAATDQFTELAKFPALEGKTWNHPVLAGDRLLVRNDNEMAAFRLSLER